MFATLKARYEAFSERVLASLSEIEREDVKSFDRWFYGGDGWRWLVGIIAATTFFAWVASQLPWNMSFLEAAVLFNVVMLMLLWAGLTAWFGYRKFSGKLFRYIVLGPLLALFGAFIGAGVAGLVKGVEPLAWLQDSAKVRHVVIAGLVFGTLYSLVVALIAALRNREYKALAAHLEAERRQSELSRQLAESKLRMLQLQIEPHFLFNTLGSAQQLAERGAPEAARLISNLIRFLRAATPSMRNEATTLAQEAALIEAYLEIMKRRLGKRLAYAVCDPGGPCRHGPAPGHADHAGRECDQAWHRAIARGRAHRRSGRMRTAGDALADGGRYRVPASMLARSPGRGSALRTSASVSRCCSASGDARARRQRAERLHRAHSIAGAGHDIRGRARSPRS